MGVTPGKKTPKRKSLDVKEQAEDVVKITEDMTPQKAVTPQASEIFDSGKKSDSKQKKGSKGQKRKLDESGCDEDVEVVKFDETREEKESSASSKTPESSSKSLKNKKAKMQKESEKIAINFDAEDKMEVVEDGKDEESVALSKAPESSSKSHKKKKGKAHQDSEKTEMNKVEAEKKAQTNNESKKSDDKRKTARGVTTRHDEEDEEADIAIPEACKLFITGLGLEGMTRDQVNTFFKEHGHSVLHVAKQNWSRHGFVSFGSVDETNKALKSLDKIDCKGSPLSVDTCERMLTSLRLQKIGSAVPNDRYLYVSPITPDMRASELLHKFGAIDVFRRNNRNWARLLFRNPRMAKNAHNSRQGKMVRGCAVKLESVEEFNARVAKEGAQQQVIPKDFVSGTRSKKRDKRRNKKLQKVKESKKTGAKEESSSSDSDSE